MMFLYGVPCWLVEMVLMVFHALHVAFFFLNCFIYLKCRVTEKERRRENERHYERERELLSIHWFMPLQMSKTAIWEMTSLYTNTQYPKAKL